MVNATQIACGMCRQVRCCFSCPCRTESTPPYPLLRHPLALHSQAKLRRHFDQQSKKGLEPSQRACKGEGSGRGLGGLGGRGTARVAACPNSRSCNPMPDPTGLNCQRMCKHTSLSVCLQPAANAFKMRAATSGTGGAGDICMLCYR